ncbi:hypothetical protein K437DRAFT_250949 [Tilletiaria anomala UBC 951]|uniref:VLRF1 domain-containing protein n=1 Tax=Tilletiaria anomala (strain ATCC 24038 / CBS 436.72 / UBC 951) TaxID=1037660 RepID=A0A066VB84_TILAU|nr:uncharacterized protein K437DRAFT_250949 [Tilletiaria anomala UBC 951]KDN39002.1 hypothetical protein K437DRAFT_250949 [Tilletiaria anomala UBC 951]
MAAPGAGAGAGKKQTNSFSTKPLYAFDLPLRVLQHLEVCESLSPLVSTYSYAAAGRQSSKISRESSDGADGTSCHVCPHSGRFPSVEEQRAHFRGDWHRFNVQLSLSGNADKVMSEAAFERATEDLDTASEDDASGGEADELQHAEHLDTVARLLATLSTNGNGSASDTENDTYDRDPRRTLDSSDSTRIWFESGPSAPQDAALPSMQLGVHRALFPDLLEEEAPQGYLQQSLRDMHAGRLSRRPGQGTGWVGKRLKSGNAADVGRSMQMNILDGEGYVPHLQLKSKEEAVDEDVDSGLSTAASDSEDGDPRSLALPSNPGADPPLRMWTVLMMGGGHFAAAVIALNPHVVITHSKKKGTVEEHSLIVLAHRTFHRYTTRRKQGGSQSAQDASGKFAKSAGAQLRRYGEESLKEEIKQMLDLPGWRSLIERSERVWVRAGKRSAKGTLWQWEGRGKASPLDAARTDGRLLSLPIQTRRPNLAEVLRCFFELSRVRVSHFSPEGLELKVAERQAADVEQKQRSARKRAAQEARRSKATQRLEVKSAARREREALTEQERSQRLRFERLAEMVVKGRVESLANFIEKYGFSVLDSSEGQAMSVDSLLPRWWRMQQAEGSKRSSTPLIPSTLLQLAAEGGDPDMVRFLLVEKHADPTRPVLPPPFPSNNDDDIEPSAPHRAAYDLCSTKAAREIFRRLMAEQPGWWNWAGTTAGGARVPSALTEEMADAKAAKVKDRRAALREKARERAAREGTEVPFSDTTTIEPQGQPTVAAGAACSSLRANVLGGKNQASRILKGMLDESSMTPEIRTRIEREKRARAAEERIKQQQQAP